MVSPFSDARIRFLLSMLPSYHAGVGVDAVTTDACGMLSSWPSAESPGFTQISPVKAQARGDANLDLKLRRFV